MLEQGRRVLTVGLLLLITIVAFEALAVATVLPAAARQLGHVNLYGWAFSAFMLCNLVGITTWGAMADRLGSARPLTFGLLLFAGGLLIGGTAPSMLILILGRAVQGLGAGSVPAVAYVAIGLGYPAQARAKMLAAMSTAWVVPGMIGPALAGGVAQAASWRYVFLGLIPFVVVAGALTVRALTSLPRPSPDGDRDGPASPGPAAGPGLRTALRLAAGATTLLAGLNSSSVVVAIPLMLAGGAVAFPALRRILPPGTLRAAPGIPAAIAIRGLLTLAYFGTEAFLPLALTSVRHQGEARAGLVLTSATLAWTAGSWVQARVGTRWGRRRTSRTGLVLVGAGIATVGATLSPSIPVAVAFVGWALAGSGMGLAYPAGSLVVLDDAPPEMVGAVSATMSVADVLGTAVGAGVGGAAVAWALAAGAGRTPGIALADAFAVVGLVVALVAARGLSPAPRTRPAEVRPAPA